MEEQKLFVSVDAPAGTVFSVSRDEKCGGPMHFSAYDMLREAFENLKRYSQDMYLNGLLRLTSSSSR